MFSSRGGCWPSGDDETGSVDGGRRSEFFRDLAGGRFLALAEAGAAGGEAEFDQLVGLFDKAILEPGWIHVQCAAEGQKPRGHVLEAFRDNGQMFYKVYNA